MAPEQIVGEPIDGRTDIFPSASWPTSSSASAAVPARVPLSTPRNDRQEEPEPLAEVAPELPASSSRSSSARAQNPRTGSTPREDMRRRGRARGQGGAGTRSSSSTTTQIFGRAVRAARGGGVRRSFARPTARRLSSCFRGGRPLPCPPRPDDALMEAGRSSPDVPLAAIPPNPIVLCRGWVHPGRPGSSRLHRQAGSSGKLLACVERFCRDLSDHAEAPVSSLPRRSGTCICAFISRSLPASRHLMKSRQPLETIRSTRCSPRPLSRLLLALIGDVAHAMTSDSSGTAFP